MYKYIAALCIMTGSLGVGMDKTGKLKEKCETIKQLLYILNLFESEIRFGRNDLPGCCKLAAGQLLNPWREALLEVDRKMEIQNGLRFADVFSEEMSICMQRQGVEADTGSIFFRFVGEKGYVDRELQIELLRQSEEELREKLAIAEKEKRSYGSLFLKLSVFGGAFLIIALW